MESDNQTHRAGSLFVLHDELGYPQKAEVSPIPAERVNMPFMAFIRGVYEVNRSGWYVPHGKICCYDMIGERLSVAGTEHAHPSFDAGAGHPTRRPAV